MPVPAIFCGHCCESPVKLTHQVGRFHHMTFQNCWIGAIGEKNRQVCPHQSVAKITCDFRWRSNSPRSAYQIARCVAGFKLGILLKMRSYENIAGGFLFTCSYQSLKIPIFSISLTLEIVETLRTNIVFWYIEICRKYYAIGKLYTCTATYKKFSLGNLKSKR